VDYGPLTSPEHGTRFTVILTLRHASPDGCRYHRPPSKIEKEGETMGLRLLAASPILLRQQLVHRRQLVNQRKPLGRTGGHAHFWQRAAANSRRTFLQAGATLAAGLAIPRMLHASVEQPLPNPIPTGSSGQRPYFSCVSSGNLARACGHYGLQWRPWRN